MTDNKDIQFWQMRSQKYNQLEWANKSEYLQAFLQAGEFKAEDRVLDVGTGTGIIANSVAPYVRHVTGIDIYQDMLDRVQERPVNVDWQQMDTHDLRFEDSSFNKITARMVFHHVTCDTEGGMKECYRVLKEGGQMVFSEGVPPTEHVKEFYTEMFKLKEERITFMEDDLTELMKQGGFKRIDKQALVMPQVSIKNWLESSGIPQENQDKIFQMHLDLDEKGKQDYKMTITETDCLIDMKFIILVGYK